MGMEVTSNAFLPTSRAILLFRFNYHFENLEAVFGLEHPTSGEIFGKGVHLETFAFASLDSSNP